MGKRFLTWSFTVVVVGIVIALATVGTGAELAGSALRASPSASPAASPMASPIASPVAGSERSTTQIIIVGEVTIEMTDEGFRPTYFESAVGRDITITLVNAGTEPHNFTVEEFDIDVDLEPGETATVEIDQPQLGRYQYFSDLPGDEEMEGSFSVFI